VLAIKSSSIIGSTFERKFEIIFAAAAWIAKA